MVTYEKHRSTSIDYIYHQFDDNLNFNAHFHDSFELIYVFEGEITVVIETIPYKIKKGEGVLILPNQIHSYKTEVYSKTYLVVFSSSYVAKFYKQSLKYFSKNPILNLENREDLITSIMTSKDMFLLKSSFYYLIHIYNQSQLEQRDIKQNTITQNILTYVEENYQKDISLDTLAKYLGYDYHYLSGYIKTISNSNFSTFINEYRIDKVCQLMIDNPSASISDLAYQCGYSSLRTFNRNFLLIKKIKPSEYRQNLSQKVGLNN